MRELVAEDPRRAELPLRPGAHDLLCEFDRVDVAPVGVCPAEMVVVLGMVVLGATCVLRNVVGITTTWLLSLERSVANTSSLSGKLASPNHIASNTSITPQPLSFAPGTGQAKLYPPPTAAGRRGGCSSDGATTRGRSPSRAVLNRRRTRLHPRTSCSGGSATVVADARGGTVPGDGRRAGSRAGRRPHPGRLDRLRVPARRGSAVVAARENDTGRSIPGAQVVGTDEFWDGTGSTSLGYAPRSSSRSCRPNRPSTTRIPGSCGGRWRRPASSCRRA